MNTPATTSTDSTSGGLIARVRTLAQPVISWWASASNAARMLVVFLFVMAAYFAIFEPTIDAYNRIATAADAKESQLRDATRGGDQLKTASTTVGMGVLNYGQIQPPGDPQETPIEFNKVLSAVLDRHNITSRTSTTRNNSLKANSPLQKALGKDHKIERIVQDVQFDATPDQAFAVVADLEREAIVSTISRFQIRKDTGRGSAAGTVRVSMAVETWIKSKTGGTR